MSEDKSDTTSQTERKRKGSGPEKTLSKMEESIKTTMKEVNDKVEDFRKKVITSKEVQRLTRNLNNFMQRQENPAFLVKLDEFSFSFGVLSSFLTFALLFYPNINVLATWVTFINIVLVLLRFVEYKSKQWHYFFFDYCYFVCAGSWVYIIGWPKSPTLFYMICMNSFSPLLNYFIIFKPKLIFQSREALTSFFMHYTPGLLFWVLRYFNTAENGGRYLSTTQIEVGLKGWSSQLWVFFLGMGFYTAWVIFYYLFIFQIRKKKIKTCNYPTLFSYTVDDFKRFNGLILHFGERWAPLSYMTLHLVQGLLGNLMSLLLINFQWVSICALAFYIVFPIWNSSVYYFEHFSRDYNSKLLARADDFKEKRIKRSNSFGNLAAPKRKLSDSNLKTK